MERKRRPWIALILSLFLPGLGHVYAGVPMLGALAWVAAFAALLLGKLMLMGTFVGLVLTVVLVIMVRIVVCIDAYLRAKRIGVVTLKRYQRWYAYPLIWVLVMLVSMFAVFPVVDETARFKTYRIPSGAMQPTLQIGDFLIVDMWAYSDSSPSRGDVVVFKYPEDPRRDFIKRCIALPGDNVEIRDKQVFINGAAVNEDYVVHADPNTYGFDGPASRRNRDQMSSQEIPLGSYFFLGDNRDNSLDSRFWGMVPHQNLRGKAKYIYWGTDVSRVNTPIE